MGLSDNLLKAIDDLGYKQPTPIQQQAIPYVLMARDVLGCAQTGTGKTASFTLPMLDILSEGRAKARMPRSLIISPTRELAAQIAENFEKYGKYQNLSMALLIGGSNMGDQAKALQKGVDVLIATPGRLLDMFDRGNILASNLKLLVIDEADRMLDMGFMPDVERIVSLLPKMRQTLMFSATMAKEIRRLADVFLANPKEITVEAEQSTAATVKQHLLWVPPRGKRIALRSLLKSEDVTRAFLFCNRKRDVTEVCKSLQRHGFSAEEMHGDLSQSERMATLERFKADEIKLLVCSDVAARGIDVSDISHVFLMDVPNNAEDYVHRIGRTGRAGREGRAFMFATALDTKLIAGVEKQIKGQVPGLAIEDVAFETLEELGKGSTKRVNAKKGKKDKASDDQKTQSKKSGSSNSGSSKSGSSKSGPSQSGPRDKAEFDDTRKSNVKSKGKASRNEGANEPMPSVDMMRQSLPSDVLEDEDLFLRACNTFEHRVPAFVLRGAKTVGGKSAAVESVE